MKTLTLMMLLTFTLSLSGCRNGANIHLNHTEKSYSPVFVYLPNGDIDSRDSYCIVSAQKFSLSGHEFLPVKTKEHISFCDRAIGYKGSKVYEFFNKAAFEIQKGLGFQSGKSNEATSAIDDGQRAQRYEVSEKY